MTTDDFYELAKNDDVEVIRTRCSLTGSMSIMTDGGVCYIGIDDSQLTGQDEKIRLAHELGHCETGAFYNRYSKLDLISKKEYKADKWAINMLLPKNDMEVAISNGCVELWQLAEYFDISEEYVKKAMWIYFDKIL